MAWWSIAWFSAFAAVLALLHRPNHAIAMGCFAAGFVVLGLRDRFHIMSSDKARDRRALVVFGVFVAILLAIPPVAAAVRAL